MAELLHCYDMKDCLPKTYLSQHPSHLIYGLVVPSDSIELPVFLVVVALNEFLIVTDTVAKSRYSGAYSNARQAGVCKCFEDCTATDRRLPGKCQCEHHDARTGNSYGREPEDFITSIPFPWFSACNFLKRYWQLPKPPTRTTACRL